MTRPIDDTHDPQLRSWVETANGSTDFPIQNLPFGVFRPRGTCNVPRVGVAIGDQILDLHRCRELNVLDGLPSELVDAAAVSSSLNPLMTLGRKLTARLRHCVSTMLRADSTRAEPSALVPMADADMHMPVDVGDYSDFYASIFHATNVGKLLRPDTPLLPNYPHVPVAYHGRSSSIVVSGTPVQRPHGQTRPRNADHPTYGPSQQLDYELEVGIAVGQPNTLGHPVGISEAEDHVFGLCLLNDWSARDMQVWESQPLGPFLSKSFATSISPWLVTLDALAPFRCPAFARRPGDPRLLPYLSSEENDRTGGVDISVEVRLRSAEMRRRGLEHIRVSRGSFRSMFWTVAQMIAHQTSNGCSLRPGDLPGRVNVFETTWFSIYCSDSPPSTRCIDDRSSGGRRRATTSSCESSGVPVVGPGASWRVVFDGGLIHTAVGKVSGRGGPLTNRSGCAA